MHRLLITSSAVVAGLVGVAALASPRVANAGPTVEVGGTAGVHVFATDNELGVPDVKNADSERNSALFGLRLGVFFNKMIGIEAEFGVIPSEGREQVYDIWNITYRAHIVVQYAKTGDEKLIPFALLGGGAMSVVSTDGEGDPTKVQKDTDAELYFGIGAKYRVDNGFGLRGDARILFPPSSQSTSFTEDFEVLLSIYKEFGHNKKIEPPPVPKDTDGDGITDDKDKCPTQAEDKDGYQDADGCPDPDNDGDGILDADDKCPNDAGPKENNGCPDKDSDGDGIIDRLDKCPTEAGPKENDGCPDKDSDNDGIVDRLDHCPDQPETKNGYQDEDGCPDEIPQKLKKFSGAIQGVNFQVGSDIILASSNSVLDEAVKVLTEYKDIKLEIQGHTDDQDFNNPNAKIKNNQDLSQARADAVKAYMVKKGIDEGRLTSKGYGSTVPSIDPKGLTGGKLQEARTKNRRVEFKLVSALTQGTGSAPPAQTPPAQTPPATPPSK